MRTTFAREVTAVYRGPRRATTKVRGPSDAVQFIRRVLPDNSREHSVVLHLDAAHQIVAHAVAPIGTANFCQVHPREIIQGVILAGAVTLIVSHNHPSGDTSPGRENKAILTRLKEGANSNEIGGRFCPDCAEGGQTARGETPGSPNCHRSDVPLPRG